MDAAEDWNGLDDYSIFLPEDSFNLFGEYDLDLGLNDSFLPALDETSAMFDMAGWDRIETMIPALPGLDVTLPTSGEPHDLIPNPEAELQASQHTSASSPGSARSPISEDQSSTDGFSASGNKVEHQPKSALRNRKFLTAFSVESGKEIRLHTRKRFSKEQRRVVALNRIIGVCLHCRLRKVACNDGIPCKQCIKRVGSISSGQEICMRRSLVATRFDHIDLIRIASVEYTVSIVARVLR
ncbi:hypothetical protein F5882DRAFT_514251 [Hyaloscypha sp. PMI_1271]|nr:hypothetical protein F5882DRAFT_514251 [Hyaloscypha sp. PMI_1271]